MSAETLLTAAHRLTRFFRIDSERGGMIVDDTLKAHWTLAQQLELVEPEERGDLYRTAARAAQLFHLDATRHGGLISITTEIAFDALDKAIRAVGGRRLEEAVDAV